jgi:hypothetical protein
MEDGMAKRPNPLHALQQNFALIDVNGDIRVIDRNQVDAIRDGSDVRPLALYKLNDARLKFRRQLENVQASFKPNEVIENFLISPQTQVYDEIVFTPSNDDPYKLNLWVDPIEADPSGDCSSILDFLLLIICNNNPEIYDYLIKYLSHMIQNPDEKPGIAIVLLGRQGTGKGMFFRLLQAIWTTTALQVSNVQNVIGQFNAILEHTYVVCMDEALFAGNKKDIDRLKSLITEPVIMIEQKYQPARHNRSIHRLFAASNHDHFANIEHDDRRFVILKVSDKRQLDTTYFGELAEAIKTPEIIGSFSHYLRTIDLSDFNIRAKPNTQEHMTQRLKSLSGFERYWFEVLTAGDLSGKDRRPGQSSNSWSQSTFISTIALIDNYELFDKNATRFQPIQSQAVHDSMNKLCPSARAVRSSRDGQQQRGFKLPSINKARTDFENLMGGAIRWS